MRMREYARNSVTVKEPVLVNAYMKEKEYLCSLDMDKLMAGFRETAGIPKKADKYTGGWEDKDYAGHTLGHYMTALAQVYAKEQSAEIKERLEYILSELEQSQKQSGFLFAHDEEYFARLEKGEPYKLWYVMHKLVMGLISVYRMTGMEQAKTIVVKLGDWIADRVLNWTEKQKRWTLTVADGGMNDCLYELSKLTEDEKYAQAAAKFDEEDMYTSLSMGKDILANKHAADTISKVLGALNRYMTIGETEVRSLETAKNFFDMVAQGHTFITGGNGEMYHFRTPGDLAKNRTQYNSETCSTYAMMKLAQRLYSLTGDKKYMDYYEQVYFNAMLGAQNPEDGMTACFQSMASGYFKTFSTPTDKFWCCTGTGMKMFTTLDRSIYHRGEDAVYVNLYISSVLEDKESGVKLTQKIDWESYDIAEFTLELNGANETELYFRMPEWAGDKVEVTINGTAVETTVTNGYLHTDKMHENGERIVLKFHPVLTLHKLPEMEYCVAATYGPFVMAAGLGTEDMITECMKRTNVDAPTKSASVKDRIVLKEGLNRSEWLANYKENFVKKDGELTYTLTGLEEDAEVAFRPYYKLYNERYGIYVEYYDEENLPDDLRAIKEEKKRLEEERLAAEAEAARKAEEERLRKEEAERKIKEEEQRRRDAVRLQQEEEERQRQEELRKQREEDYRLRRGIELQRQELQRRAEAEAEERERREDEERKKRAEEERKRREEERRLAAAAEEEKKNEEEEKLFEMSLEERFRMEQEEERRRAEEEEAARLRREQEEEEARRRKEEEQKRREEEYRLRRGIDLQRQEMEERRQEGDEGRERRAREEEERIRKEEARKKREEEYRLYKERELQRQEMERRRQEEAEEAERKRKLEEEEAKKRAADEKKLAEEKEKQAAAQQLADAQRAAELAEARLREEEAKLLLAKLSAERAQIEATIQPGEEESGEKRWGGLRGLFGGKKR